MLMKDSTAVSNQWCMPVTSWAVQFCLTPGLLSTRSKVINYKYVKKIKQNHTDCDKDK